MHVAAVIRPPFMAVIVQLVPDAVTPGVLSTVKPAVVLAPGIEPDGVSAPVSV